MLNKVIHFDFDATAIDRAGHLPYLLLQLVSQHRFTPGTVSHIEVAHDNDCEFLRGTGACNCEPTISLLAPDRIKKADPPKS